MARVAVDDPDDPRIVEFTGLRDHDLRRQREAPGGDMAGVFIAEGDVVVSRALAAGYRCRAAMIDATRRVPLPAGLEEDDALTIYAAGPAVLRRITGMGVHRGVLASFDRRPLPPVDALLANAKRIVILENVVNPTNVGVIARTAAAFGIDALLVDPTTCDPLYRRASRVSMGEVFALAHGRLGHVAPESRPDALDVVTAHGFILVALTPDSAADDLRAVAARIAPNDRVALVLGTEGHGLPPATLARCRPARIAIAPTVDSLNVGVAAAIAMYELTTFGPGARSSRAGTSAGTFDSEGSG